MVGHCYDLKLGRDRAWRSSQGSWLVGWLVDFEFHVVDCSNHMISSPRGEANTFWIRSFSLQPKSIIFSMGCLPFRPGCAVLCSCFFTLPPPPFFFLPQNIPLHILSSLLFLYNSSFFKAHPECLPLQELKRKVQSFFPHYGKKYIA